MNGKRNILNTLCVPGRWGGVVTQTRITHATPAAAYAHVANRDWEADIPPGVDGRDLCKDNGYQLVMDENNQDIRVGI